MTDSTAPSPTSMVNPTAENLAALAAVADEGPIIMLNLLRFSEPDGRTSYGRYTAVASHTVQARGGSVPFMGQAIGPSDWDTAILVRYPRRAAYLDMQSDPAYLGAIPDRTAGLSARLITPFHDPVGTPEEPFAVAAPEGEEALVVCVDDAGASGSGEVLLELHADVALVTDRVWSRLTVLRFESVDAAVAARPGEGIWFVTRG